MGDIKGETTKKSSHSQQQQQQTPKQQQQSQTQTQGVSSSSPKDPLEEQQNHPHVIISSSSPSPFDQTATSNNPKRTRYTATTGQWKILPSPKSSQQPKQVQTQMTVMPSAATESSPIAQHQQQQPQISSSDTASSPSQSTLPSLSGSIQDTGNKPESDLNPVHHQLRKGKYVSPVWKPNEMLCLARAWRVQYQTSGSTRVAPSVDPDSGGQAKGKTRAEKDREVAEYLNRHGVNRDAKTAGTKWDNMLGEFRKVYEWERGGERETVGKSYFRLSPYERKLHRLPASFDEEVFEELAQFMGSRLRSSSSSASPQSRSCGLIPGVIVAVDDNVHRSRTADDQFPLTARSKQLMIMGSGVGGGDQTYYGYGGVRQSGPSMGFDQTVLGDMNVVIGSSPATKELRRIGKVRMAWEESVSLWAEEGENHRGRVKLLGGSLNFLKADELTYFDEAMVASTMEGFEEGPLKGFSVDRFVPGQQVKVFGRKKSIPATTSSTTTTTSGEKVTTQQLQLPFTESSLRSISPWEFQDPSEYYIGCLRVPPASIPSLFDLSWYLQEPPPEDLRFPLRKDVFRDLPQGKDLFFTIAAESLDSRAVTYDILTPILRTNPSLTAPSATSRDSFVGLWDDCVNRIVSKFSSAETIMVRKPTFFSSDDELQDEWPNVTAFTRGLCLWRGEETDQIREGQVEPSNSIVEKLLWTYGDLPYILGYYAVGFSITFCALSRGPERIIRTDLHTLDLSSPSDRLKALVPCYRIAGLLGLLADRCFNGNPSQKVLVYSDFERFESNGNASEATPNTVTRFYGNKRKWTAAKEIYDFLDHRIPHAEFVTRASERDLSLTFKPRGIRSPPSKLASSDQLVEALKCVTKALVALHDLSFMHRDLKWDKISRRVNERGESEWFVSGFEEAVGAPQIYPYRHQLGSHAPEMERGLHGVKVDVWGVGNMVREWFSGAGATSAPAAAAKMLRELQKRCLEQNPEARPTAADCYHHLLQLQSTHHHMHASV